MKKEELKKVLKPLIKECIKEVMFEDGTLSTIIAEVAVGLGASSKQQIVETEKILKFFKNEEGEMLKKEKNY